MSRVIRVGTRGSDLAVWQARFVMDTLRGSFPDLELEMVPIQTEGDLDTTSSLREIGGKGVFIKAIEEALLDKTIDIAVHSFKDITSNLAEGCRLAAFFSPDVKNDCWLHPDRVPLTELSAPSVIGTGSMRRWALLKGMGVSATCQSIRGNVQTRINKLIDGECDGLLLSEAGLQRLGLMHHVVESLDPQAFVPAPGQGVIACEIRDGDDALQQLCDVITDAEQTLLSDCELLLLREIGFDCNVPLGVYVTRRDDQLAMRVFLSDENGVPLVDDTFYVELLDYEEGVVKVAQMLRSKIDA